MVDELKGLLMDLPFALTTKHYHHPKAPFYHLVPKDLKRNFRFRRRMIELGSRDPSAASDIWKMCARDILFFVNTFCWTYDPRRKPSRIPFLTWPFQDDGLLAVGEAAGSHHLRISKSRDMGASWMVLTVFFWRWLFSPAQSFLLGSRKEEFVDKSGDPKTLMYKLDFLYDALPHWLRPRRLRNKLTFHNLDNGATIDGESTNQDFARGDRRTAIMLDEFAAVENQREVLAAVYDASDSAIAVSTYQGTGNEFYNLKWPTIEWHWSLHPRKAAGLYSVDANGVIDLVDTEYWLKHRKKEVPALPAIQAGNG